jgi:hypothetical protein
VKNPRWRTGFAVIAAAAIGVSAGAMGAAAAVEQAADNRTGTVVNVCSNPLLDQDQTGWGRHGTGATGSRTPATSHVVARYAYTQPAANGANPEMYLPQKSVTPGESWTFAMDTWVSGTTTPVTVTMQVDWYTATGAYIQHTEGTATPITPGATERWTRTATDFTAPATAARANVTAQLNGPAGLTWAATACDYRPTGTGQPPTTPPDQDDTAAARHNWGTPLPASDEFDYGSPASPAVPDRTKWSIAGGAVDACEPGHVKNGRRCDKNTRVLGGIARLTGESNGDTGWLGSKLSQKYGRWEVRARSQATGTVNATRTYHPVLITWPRDHDWPQGAEYDFLENDSPGENCAQAFLHFPNHEPRRQEHATRCDVDLTQWHNFGFEWTPQHLKGYLNGAEWFHFDRDCVQCAPGRMYQTIQLDNFSGPDQQPAIFEIDFARVYAIPGVSQ